MTDLPPLTDTTNRPPVIAFRLDGKGQGVRLDPAGLDQAPERKGFRWVHVHLTDSAGAAWIENADLDSDVRGALTAEETRPRCAVHDQGILLNLRGVNLNPGSEPEDMVSVRMWIERHQVISVWLRPLYAIQDLFDSIGRNQGPTTPGELVARLALRLADRAEPTVTALNERIDDLEDQALDPRKPPVSRRDLSDIRLSAILLRRYLFPQRDALTTFQIEDVDWLTPYDRGRVREAADWVTRLGEELDAIRDRAQILHEQILDQRAEVMNKQMLILSIVASIFLPLSLVASLLGINVAGIPGAESPYAFWVVVALLMALGLFEVWLFRKLMFKR